MKIPFRKNNREFSEGIRKRSALQQNIGLTGNQSRKEIIVDKDGKAIEVGQEFKGIEISDEGIPNVFSTVVGNILDCGHPVMSIHDVSGTCSKGHVVCQGCGLNECRVCGGKLCQKDNYFLDKEGYVCSEHIKTVIAERSLFSIYYFIRNGVLSFFGFESDD